MSVSINISDEFGQVVLLFKKRISYFGNITIWVNVFTNRNKIRLEDHTSTCTNALIKLKIVCEH